MDGMITSTDKPKTRIHGRKLTNSLRISVETVIPVSESPNHYQVIYPDFGVAESTKKIDWFIRLTNRMYISFHVDIITQITKIYLILNFLFRTKKHRQTVYLRYPMLFIQCGRRDLNSHRINSHQNLNLARLPFRHFRSTSDIIPQLFIVVKPFFKILLADFYIQIRQFSLLYHSVSNFIFLFLYLF